MKVWDTTKYVVRQVVTHPFNIATAVAVLAAYFKYQPPVPVDQLITFLSRAAAPCALFALGVTVALRPYEGIPKELPLHLAIKLVLHPLLVWVVLSVVGDFDRAWVFTAMLMSSLPPAGNVFVMARQYDVYVQRASGGVLVGTVVSVLTVTLLLFLIAGDMIPHDLFPGRRGFAAPQHEKVRGLQSPTPLILRSFEEASRRTHNGYAEAGAMAPRAANPALRAAATGSSSESSERLKASTPAVRKP
eukprot:gene48956-65639_t